MRERKLELFGRLRNLSDFHWRMRHVLRRVVSRAGGDVLVDGDGPVFPVGCQINGICAERNFRSAQGQRSLNIKRDPWIPDMPVVRLFLDRGIVLNRDLIAILEIAIGLSLAKSG